MKIEEIKAMSDEELNKRVALLCGYVNLNTKDFTSRLKDMGLEFENIPEQDYWNNPAGQLCAVPDFCNDLNLMYNAEKTLVGERAGTYDCMLWVIIKKEWESVGNNAAIISSWHATARQKAEAFVLAMMNHL